MQSKTDLTGKTALITGAGSGFGRAMTVAFCQAGARVFGAGRRQASLDETAKLAGDRFTAVQADISNRDEALDLIDKVVSIGGALHILVNNAAVLRDHEAPLTRLKLEDWDATIDTNVSAPFVLSQAAFKPMAAQKYGRIINISSGLGFRPMQGYGSYCISKAALNMLTRVFALEGQGLNILVNAVDPGVAHTELNTWASESPETVNAVALYLASLSDNGPTGACFNKRLQQLEW